MFTGDWAIDKLFWLIFGLFLVVLLLVFFCRRYRQFCPLYRKNDIPLRLRRSQRNPAISPLPYKHWEMMGTFNPAAWQDDSGSVHLIYRAVGGDGVSRLGYTQSLDGLNFLERSPYPIFSMSNPHDDLKVTQQRYSRSLYPSGGSWGGTEDPRVVEIDDRLYVTFNLFAGWNFIRIAVTSIKEEDFLAKRWNWSKPIFISPAGEINKNWVLFPEKFNGRFAILHSISPEVQIDYVDRLEDLANGKKAIKSRFGQKKARPTWDTFLRGAGSPPIKTDQGWLVLYHATNKHEPHKYQVGALLLDLKNPTKVIARSPGPLLLPDMWYENDWKPGIVYVCGTIIKDGLLYVYYGGGDKHICVAQTPLRPLLDWLLRKGIKH